MRDWRGSGSTKLLLSAVLFAACAAAGDFEVPPAEPAAASLPAELRGAQRNCWATASRQRN